MTTLLLLAILSPASVAAVKCDFDSLTHSCQVFSPSGPYQIKMPDGKTFIPNYASLVRAADAQEQARKEELPQIQRQIDQKMDQATLTATSVFDELPVTKASALFKIKFLRAMPKSLLIVGSKLNANGKLRLPWPPGDKDASEKMVDASTVADEFKQILTSAQLARLQEADALFTEAMATSHDFNQAGENPAAKEINAISPERKARVAELVEMARRSDVHAIVGNRPPSEWSVAESSAVAKLKLIVYHSGDSAKVRSAPDCQGLVTNAFYSDFDHSINICPGFYNFPDETIIGILGHEMGHSVDPCGAQSSVLQFDVKAWAARSDAEKDAMLKTLDQQQVGKYFDAFSDGNVTQTARNIEADLNNPRSLDAFKTNGLLSPTPAIGARITQDGSDLNGYVLADIYACLAGRGGNFRQVTDAQLRDAAETIVAKRKESADSKYDPIADEKRIIAAFKRYPQCESPREHTQMREAIADWFGAQAEASFTANKSAPTDMDRLAAIGFFSTVVCMERGDLKPEENGLSTTSIIDDAKSSLNAKNDEHPASKSRIDRIFLSDPQLRQHLGCEPSKYPSCTHSTTKSHVSNPADTEARHD